MEFVSSNTAPLNEAQLIGAAAEIGCDVAAVEAVSQVEAPHGGFIADGRPTLLFESHAFHKLTNGRWDMSHPHVSTTAWQHNYGAAGAHQYDRLHEAIALNRNAALKSASWGKYQIMGENFYDAGYDTVESFVADMVESEGAQLEAFVCFLQNTEIDQHLIAHDWIAFAHRYNGPGQVGEYASRIAAAYRELSR